MMRPDRFTAVFGVSVPFMQRGEKFFLQHLREAGRTDFYMFSQMGDEAVEAWADASKTIPGVLYTASATLPLAERWTAFDPTSLFLKKPKETLPPWADPEDVEYTISEYQRTGFRTALNYYRAMQLGFDLSAPFKGAKIHQPCYFIIGQEDALKPLFDKTVDEFREDMPGLRGVRVVEGVGHWVAQEKPEVLNAALLEFLHGLKQA